MEVSLNCLNLVRPAKEKLPPMSGGGEPDYGAAFNHLKWVRDRGSGPTKSPDRSEPGTRGVSVGQRFLRKNFSKVGCIETQRIQFKVKGPEPGRAIFSDLSEASFSR